MAESRRKDSEQVAGVRVKSPSLMKALAYYAPSYAVSIGGNLVLNAAAARTLGVEDFGYFVLVFTATVLVGQFSLLGVHRSGLREAAKAESAETVGALRHGVRAVLLIPLPLASVATAAVMWGLDGGDPDDWLTAALSGALVFLAGYQKINANFLRGLGHVRAATMLTGRSGGSLIAVGQATCVLLVAVVVPGWGLPGILAGTAVGYLVPLVWATWLLRRRWPRIERHPRTLHDLRVVVRRDWRFAMSQTGGFLNSTLELWLAGVMLSGGATSLFAAAHRLSHLVVVPHHAIQVVFSPAVARLAARDQHGRLEPLVRTAATVATVASGLLWLPMVIVPGLVLTTVFGAGFDDAVVALVLLASAYLLNASSGPASTTLSMSHHEGVVALISWGLMAPRVASGVACALAWGVIGLAASTAAMAIITYALTWWAARSRVGISTHVTLRPNLSLLRQIRG